MGLYEQREEFKDDVKKLFQLVDGEIDECTVHPGALFFLYRQNTDFARPADLEYELAGGVFRYGSIKLTAEDWADARLQFDVDFGANEGIYLDLYYEIDGKTVVVGTVKTLRTDRDAFVALGAYGAALVWSSHNVWELAYQAHWQKMKAAETSAEKE